MKLAAEIEFLPQEIWNKTREKLLVDLMAVGITRTLSFFSDMSFRWNVFWARKKHTVGVHRVRPWRRLRSGAKPWAGVVHSRQLAGRAGGAQGQSGSSQFLSQLHLLSSWLPEWWLRNQADHILHANRLGIFHFPHWDTLSLSSLSHS